MELLVCERIDHGYTIIDNPELTAEARRRGITFAVEPTNSYYLRTLPDEEWAEGHPIRAMAASRLKVFPNSDDSTMHHVSISESWLLMKNWLGFSIKELRGFLENAIDSVWVDDAAKARLRTGWLSDFDRLAAEAFLSPAPNFIPPKNAPQSFDAPGDLWKTSRPPTLRMRTAAIRSKVAESPQCVRSAVSERSRPAGVSSTWPTTKGMKRWFVLPRQAPCFST